MPMADLAEIALAFCKECAGFKNAFLNPEHEMVADLLTDRALFYHELDDVMDMVEKWLSDHEDFGLVLQFARPKQYHVLKFVHYKQYRVLIQDETYTRPECIGESESDNRCHAFLAACVEAARKLKEKQYE
jgi:hypothetical protein